MQFSHLWIRCFKKLKNDIGRLRLPLFLILLYLLFTNLLFETACPYAILFGRSCPACGLTRSGILILTGHFSEALALNPCICLWGTLLFYGLVYRYILDKTPPCFLLFSSVTGVLTVFWFLFTLLQGNRVPVSFDGILPAIFQL